MLIPFLVLKKSYFNLFYGNANSWTGFLRAPDAVDREEHLKYPDQNIELIK